MPESTAEPTAQETQAASAAAPQSGQVAAPAASTETAGAAKEGQAPATAEPISYGAFNLPEGVTLEADVLGEVSTLFSELKLPQDQAQRVIDQFMKVGPQLLMGSVEKLLIAQHEAQGKTWEREARESKDIGGANYEAALAEAQTAIGKFGTPEFKALLESTGLTNHPEVIRTFRGIGKEISEGGYVPSTGGDTGSALENIYNHPTSVAARQRARAG